MSARPGHQDAHAGGGKVLIVDDEEIVRRAYAQALRARKWIVEEAADATAALGRISPASFDVILSDISMPGLSGLDFLRAVRGNDLDVPVVLMTGAPDMASAIRAVEYGAFRYLTKPIDLVMLDGVVRLASRLHAMARLKREAFALSGAAADETGDRAGLELRFERALEQIWMAFQPIVSLSQRTTYGYEALLRSDEPSLASPPDILAAAERLGRVHDVGRRVRARVAQAAAGTAPARIFVNLHAADLGDDELLSPQSPLSNIADRVVLEITERASLDGVKNVAERVARLRGLGYEIAIDDLGAGYAGLTSFALLEPQVAKLDMSIVRDADKSARKRSVIRSMTQLCAELQMRVVCEGVETREERDALVEVGADLFQGYLFAKPARGFPTPAL